MRTYDLATALNILAKILRKGPNVELSKLNLGNVENASTPERPDIPTALSVLAALSGFSKNEWVAIINEYNLSVEVKTTDSTRDLLGRILNHLRKNPREVQKLRALSHKKSENISPQLQEALSILLR